MPRPERFMAPVLGAALVLVAWEGVAHASGSGWVQAVGAVVAGLLLVGMAAPAVVARRLQVNVVDAPADATRGEPFTLTIVSQRGLRCSVLRPGGSAVAVSARVSTPVTVLAPHRGVLRRVRLQLATASPFGLLWWSVEREVILDRPVLVAPKAEHRLAVLGRSGHEAEGMADPVPSSVGDTRQLRPYRMGDSRRRVHWAATAHTRTLMVRETEETTAVPVRVVADLPGDADEADLAAGAALGTVAAYLLAGAPVVLETTENDRRVAAPVGDLTDAGRRLARAGSNPYDAEFDPRGVPD